MANVESVITPYRIKQSVLEAWLKYKFPGEDITVTVRQRLGKSVGSQLTEVGSLR